MAILSEKEGKLSETRSFTPEKFQLELVFAWGHLPIIGGLAKCRGQELKGGQGGWIENLSITLGFSVGEAEK